MALRLKAAPTFKVLVSIPVAGAAAQDMEFEFRHRTVSELKSYQTEVAGKSDREVVDALLVGWTHEEPFTAENLSTFLENYHGAAAAIARAYMSELSAARRGN